MAPLGFALCPANPMFSPSQYKQNLPRQHFTSLTRILAVASSKGSSTNLITESTVSTSETVGFGFKNLTETFWVDVHGAEGRPLNVSLNAPLNINSTKVDKIENVAIRVELKNGCVGWGEVTMLPGICPGNQATALSKAKDACEFLKGNQSMALTSVIDEIGRILPGDDFASVRAGVEMALVDAVANSIGVPLWRLFGGVSNSLTTSITIPDVSPAGASELVAKYGKVGLKTFKLNIGQDHAKDIARFQAIKTAYPQCSIILDANEGYSFKEAVEVIENLHDVGLHPILFEQPTQRHDWKGLGDFTKLAKSKYGISVAADESCQDIHDVQKVIDNNLANVINVKIAKFGVMGALRIVELARKSGLNLMIDGLVGSRLASGFAAHLAAGVGCFRFVTLDAPFLLSEDPVVGGYEASDNVYKLVNARGQGGFLHWNVKVW